MASLYVHDYSPDVAAESNNKPILVLIHGGASSHRMYKDVAPILTKQGYKVYAPDMPGHGKSAELAPFTFQRSTELLHHSLNDIKHQHGPKTQIVLVGVSLGGQAVLDILQTHPDAVDSAIVSGASIHPPDDKARWEMPHMPSDEVWLDIITEDVKQMGMDNAGGIQNESFAFEFTAPETLPPVLVMVGEEDTPMSIRDMPELSMTLRVANKKSREVMIEKAWHNHPIDIPERFAETIHEWVEEVFAES